MKDKEPIEEVKAAETPAPEATPEHVVTGNMKTKNPKKMIMIGVIALVVIAVGVGLFLTLGGKNKEAKNKTDAKAVGSVEEAGGDPQSTDPVARGKYLSLSSCTGTGDKKLGSAPMKASDISIIEPYGLVAGGHVTPVDHEYYYGKDQSASPSTYDVLAPADGTIVSVEARQKGNGKADFRVVISYSCTFFSYFDLVNSLSEEIAAKMPSGYATINGPQAVKIPVTEGQVLAKIGGQSLDFAVWDTTKTLSGLLVAKAYNNAEPWKINTVAPLDHFSDTAKASILPLYVRTAEPRDGKFDHDIDGTASGNWFKKGSNGYIGAFTEADYSSQTYADTHLSIAPNFIDPNGWEFSTGAINHGTQYAIKAPTTIPSKVDEKAGIVKYELAGVGYKDQTGTSWSGKNVPGTLTLNPTTSLGTALVQLTAKRELKVEVFLGKTPAQVSAFTDAAVVYTRGDEATTMTR
jgi:hypothetical protein